MKKKPIPRKLVLRPCSYRRHEMYMDRGVRIIRRIINKKPIDSKNILKLKTNYFSAKQVNDTGSGLKH